MTPSPEQVTEMARQTLRHVCFDCVATLSTEGEAIDFRILRRLARALDHAADVLQSGRLM